MFESFVRPPLHELESRKTRRSNVLCLLPLFNTNNVLRAILIEYNKRFPHHNVIEYYVAQKGVNWPYYFWSEFRKATSEWMTNWAPDGKKGSGSGWFAKPGVVSDAQKNKRPPTRRRTIWMMIRSSGKLLSKRFVCLYQQEILRLLLPPAHSEIIMRRATSHNRIMSQNGDPALH